MMLRELCRIQTALSEADIARLEQLEQELPVIAELTNADIFIDCFDKSGRTVLVAAQARPAQVDSSVYAADVVGKTVLREMEPAVYHAVESGLPARDLKAITQEGVTVRQDVVPVRGKDGKVIGVLICEKDISGRLIREKKYDELAREKEEHAGKQLLVAGKTGDVRMREVHHRVKNNLQMIASIMNLQARRSDNQQVRRAFRENTQRVLSIAAIHDILTRGEEGGGVRLLLLLERICREIQAVSGIGSRVRILVEGDDLLISADLASSIALAVNELVTNALEHGYPGDRTGRVTVKAQAGRLFSTIWVEDDGVGYDPMEPRRGSLGLELVTLTARDKLRGDFRIVPDETGTKAYFSFRMPPKED